jgi:hypothetical protein
MRFPVLLSLVVAVSCLFACGPKVAQCNTSTCTGCCDQATDKCLVGAEVTACGKGGTFCVACLSTQVCSSNTCTAKATSSGGGSCSASNCDGCCDSTGTCLRGQSLEACGATGATCAACAVGQTCPPLTAGTSFGGRCQ